MEAPAGASFCLHGRLARGKADVLIRGTEGQAQRIADNPALSSEQRTALKTFDIEVQRLKSLRHDKGLIEIGVDALVLPRQARDEAPTSTLSIPVDQARALMLLLKQQFAELDKLQPRSRRSGRC